LIGARARVISSSVRCDVQPRVRSCERFDVVRRSSALAAILCGIAVAGGPLDAQATQRLRFVTRLGQDTIAVEQFDRTATSVIGDVVFRAPRTRIVHYEIVTTPTRQLISALLTSSAPQSAGTKSITDFTRVTAHEDSLSIERTRGDSVTRWAVPVRGPMIPWFSAQSVALWELVLRAAAPKQGDSVEVTGFRLTPGKPLRVYASRFQRDSVRVDYESFDIATHLGLDSNGHVTGLDGTPSTIKIRAVPVAELDLPGIAEQFGREDAAGRSFGVSSPRDTARATVGGAVLSIDYGRPSRRGRDVWGALLTPNEIWRLGANAATTLSTSQALKLGGTVDLPAGSYTIWLIPGTSTGTFIVNSETGQWGTQYKAAKDVARFPIHFETIAAATPEQFTARVVADSGDEGKLLFEWDGRRYVVPFRVVPAKLTDE
jgi:hypothetical protein